VIQQAAEKALRAAKYAVDVNFKFSSTSSEILQCSVPDDGMQRLTARLNELLHSSSYLRYPSNHQFPATPHDVISLQTSTRAIELTKELIEKCQEFIDRAAAV
jgi:HEPN domain-containing protein